MANFRGHCPRRPNLMSRSIVADLSPVRWRRRESSAPVVVKERSSTAGVGSSRYWSPQRGRRPSGGEKEKRNPLLERVKNTRLSCFRSSGRSIAGSEVAEPRDSEQDESREPSEDCCGLLGEDRPDYARHLSADDVFGCDDEAFIAAESKIVP